MKYPYNSSAATPLTHTHQHTRHTHQHTRHTHQHTRHTHQHTTKPHLGYYTRACKGARKLIRKKNPITPRVEGWDFPHNSTYKTDRPPSLDIHTHTHTHKHTHTNTQGVYIQFVCTLTHTLHTVCVHSHTQLYPHPRTHNCIHTHEHTRQAQLGYDTGVDTGTDRG